MILLMGETVAEKSKLFEQYAPLIRALPDPELLKKADLRVPDFRLRHDNQLDMYYAPVDYVNERAKVVLLGIKPGWAQMKIAYRQARRDLLSVLCPTEVCRRAKRRASFAGPIRQNLIVMLDQLGLPTLLDLSSSASLFHEHSSLLHTSSAIRYTVFVNGRNYTGHSARVLDTPALRWVHRPRARRRTAACALGGNHPAGECSVRHAGIFDGEDRAGALSNRISAPVRCQWTSGPPV